MSIKRSDKNTYTTYPANAAFDSQNEFEDDAQAEKGKAFWEGTPNGSNDAWCRNMNVKSQLRKQLLAKLKELAAATTTRECFAVEMCQEDYALHQLRKLYEGMVERAETMKGQMGITGCDLKQCFKSFHEDKEINYLLSKLNTLNSLSFGFLHKVCDSVDKGCLMEPQRDASGKIERDGDGNPKMQAVETIPLSLIACSMIHKPNSLLFGDKDMAALGRQLTSQRNGPSPAARGFSPCLFPIGTIARGSDSALYVNVCQKQYECDQPKTIARWVRANLMEVALFQTAKEIRSRITARKRQLIAYAKQMMTLQSKMMSMHPLQGLGRKQMKNVDPNFCLPVANVGDVVDLSLQRVKANMMTAANQQRINELKNTLDQSSMMVCNKPFNLNKVKANNNQLAGGRRRKNSKRRKSRRSRRRR
tara:strand:+ start:4351 stop:5607 length:1257 start_codon:yes stop_codon:yes gene_type:complete